MSHIALGEFVAVCALCMVVVIAQNVHIDLFE